jgi:dTMP kinase
MFITLEGSEGSGKTSLIGPLASLLQREGWQVIITREPGGTSIGDQIRSILGSLANTAMGPRTEALLFLAARAQLIDEVVLPHLNKGGIVISDRYADSTLAYQGYGRGLDLVQLQTLLDFATNKRKPDLTLFLDVDVEVGLQRRASGGEWNRLDACDLEFYQRVRHGYYELMKKEPQRWVLIDASRSITEIKEAAYQLVLDRLNAQHRT